MTVKEILNKDLEFNINNLEKSTIERLISNKKKIFDFLNKLESRYLEDLKSGEVYSDVFEVANNYRLNYIDNALEALEKKGYTKEFLIEKGCLKYKLEPISKTSKIIDVKDVIFNKEIKNSLKIKENK